MQEVLLAVWKAIPAFQGGSQPTTFVYRVSHNCAMTWRRTRGNHQRLVEQAAHDPVGSSPNSGRDEQLEWLYGRDSRHF